MTEGYENRSNFLGGLWPFWLILALALGVRLFWLILFQGQIGQDAVRYLWISEHVTRGEWRLLPQLYTSPLLPGIVGLLSRLTGDNLLTGRVLCLLANTAAVGLGMLLVLKIFPRRPMLAWLTGLGLACNHVWCRTAAFVLTDNLFYPLLLSLFLLALLLEEKATWSRGLAFGLLWALAYLARDIGLYCGVAVFLILLAVKLWKTRGLAPKTSALVRLSLPALLVLLLLVGGWVYALYQTFGIISLGEGPRFYVEFARTFDRKADTKQVDSMRYRDGAVAFFRLRPHEMMEYTRFPQPGDDRYPPPQGLRILSDPGATGRVIWGNLQWSFKEFQRVTLVGFLALMVILVGVALGRLSLTAPTVLLGVISGAVLGLHFLGPVREARLLGWFFFWLYLGLAACTLWLWDFLHSRGDLKKLAAPGSVLVAGLFCFQVLYPQYFREVPRRWQQHLLPHASQLAADYILRTQGPGAVVSSREPEAAYRCRGFWIAQPDGSAGDLVEWLYLGQADYLLLHNKMPVEAGQKILWGDLAEVRKQFPELELAAEFKSVPNETYGSWARLYRFHPQPEKLTRLKEKYPWAGTHPRESLRVTRGENMAGRGF